MKIKQLIEILKTFDENLVVIIDAGDWAGEVTSVDQSDYDKARGQVELRSDD